MTVYLGTVREGNHNTSVKPKTNKKNAITDTQRNKTYLYYK